MSDDAILVVTAPEAIFVVVAEEVTSVVESIAQGPPGPPGGGVITVTAGQNLSGHRIVSAGAAGLAVYADKDLLTSVQKVLGLTTGAAASGALVSIVPSGEITEPSWTFDTDLPVYLGKSGALTQMAPTTGAILQVGVALASTRLFIDIKTPIAQV